MNLWFIFRGEEVLVREAGGSVTPMAGPPEDLGLDTLFVQDIGELDGKRCFAAEVEGDMEGLEDTSFRDLRAMLGSIDEGFFAMAGRAKQIVNWNRSHRFCGRCGAGTVPGPTRLSKECPRCGMHFYPRLSPAAIVLITRGERALLARSPGFPPGMYSALAGFIEPGESIERAIVREVREEVGVEVRDLRYFGSQPWPFPDSLMIGFIAEYAGGELRFEDGEIEDAGWFSPQKMPGLPPRLSIARAMIDDFLERTNQARNR
ncbi:MAG: NAD(+) diphosphatase [Actinomycetota bacterium]|nr:NAD(+) diphosphatase [Actinomycetota bacterium]